MACGSGCCGPSAEATPEQATPVRAPSQDGDCCSAVSPKVEDGPVQQGSIPRRAAPSPCQDACCGGGPIEPKDAVLDDDCCGPSPATPAESNCNKGCCSPPEPPRLDDAKPGCCDGKAAPCCDESCLDRLALRECEDPGSALTASDAAPNCGRGKDGKPCADHARSTRKMYAEKLEALECICRALIALGKESCCGPQRRPSARSTTRRSSKEISSKSRSSGDPCCAAAGGAACCPLNKQSSSKRGSVDSCCAAASGSACCPPKKQLSPKKGCRKTDDGTAKLGSLSDADLCTDSCCVEERPTGAVEKSAGIGGDLALVTDLEKGFSPGDREHVILSISGMTCTGCETKLIRSLGALPSVKNLKTSLVLARAEFDVVGAAPVAEVIKHLERTTEFKCEVIKNQGSSIDIVVENGDAAALVDKPWPDGVIEVRVVDKKTVNVSFDAKVIGARDLVERGWGDGPIRLAAPRLDVTLEAGSRHVRHVGYMTLLSACLTIPVLVLAWAPLPERDLEYGSASLVLATIVQFAVAGPFYPKALKALVFSKVIEMDLLIVLSTSAAYIFSVVSFGYMASGQPLSTGQFFETSTLLVTLVMVGRWVGALARQKAVESISIRSLQTPTALLVTGDGDKEIDARLLQYGDVFKVAPDSRVPTDGTVVSGSSEVDESMITGESRPVEKQTKSPVIAGSVNGSGVLLVRLTRLPGDNTISTIAGMVDEAKLSKPKIQDIADRVASYFVPVVVMITTVTFCIWVVVGIKVRGQSGSEATIQAITYAITVLIVSCPCAIGLAVPMVIVIATGVAAERGIIFKSAEGIEVAHKTSHVVFDKTGTITEGKLSVAREWYAGNDENTTKSLLLGLVGDVKHPVSAAVAAHLKAQGVSPAPVSDAKTLTGKGVEGRVEGSALVLQAGNSRWLNLTSDPVVQSALSQGCTAFCFTIGGSIAATFALQDSIRPDAPATIKALLDQGIWVHIISGDDDGAVRSVAAQLGIAETNVRSRCTPADKRAYIQGLLEGPAPPSSTSRRTKRKKQPVVVFCGDGTNDAVALAQATIGMHMNEGGTDIAQSAADVVLMRPDLAGVLTAIAVSRKSIHRIAFNFGWSFVYNLFAILLAAGAFVNARIPPEFAGLGELVSVLPVITAAMLLRWSKI